MNLPKFIACLSLSLANHCQQVKRENRGDHIKEKNQVFDHLKATQKSGKSREDGPLVRELHAMQESIKITTSQLVDVQRGVSNIYTRLTQVEEDVRYLKEGSSSLPMGGTERESSVKELWAELRNMMNAIAALTNRVAQLEEQGRSKNYDYQSPSMSCSENLLNLCFGLIEGVL